MNKTALITLGRKLRLNELYLLSIYDLEPSGIVIYAYNQVDSKEYFLPITETEFSNAKYTRHTPSLTSLLETIELVSQGSALVLQSSNPNISKIKYRPTGESLHELIHQPMEGSEQSVNDVLTDGLVELCKAKPVGLDAIQWLGEWFLTNNPIKPRVDEAD